MKYDSLYDSLFVMETVTLKPLIWKTGPIPGYEISSDGTLFRNGKECSKFQINGRNYSNVRDADNHKCSYRIDYMVAYTFLGSRPDAIRLIHINDDITDDRLCNLIWYRKVDVAKLYKDLAIVESDGSIIEEWRHCNTEYNPELGYEVSNFGMIRDANGNPIPLHTSHGYRVFYYLDDRFAKQTRIKSVHRAVAEAFIPNPNGYSIVNHIDGDPFNDIVYNLEWANNGMNAEHAYLQNLNSNMRYSAQQIDNVCKMLSEGKISQLHISYITGVDRKTVSDIYRGRRWKEIANKYRMPDKKWTPELKKQISDMITNGKKGKEIFSELNIPYQQDAVSFYERLRRELKSKGEIS